LLEKVRMFLGKTDHVFLSVGSLDAAGRANLES
jgi:hypothetical protein